METKHTPGIWEVRSDSPYSTAGFVVFTGRGVENKTIVRLPFGNMVPQPEEERYHENKANAQLIAGAPELLEACKWAVRQFKILSEKGLYPEHLMSHNGGEGIMPLVKAIDKATKP